MDDESTTATGDPAETLETTTTPDPAGDEASPTIARRSIVRRPPSINVISAILVITGGALEGYAVALTASDAVGRQFALAWALLGAALVVTAWALRGRRWWGAAAAIAVSVVGLFAGMYGVYGVLVLTNSPTDDRANWAMTVGLIAVGAASIAIIGLLSIAWNWLTVTTPRRPTLAGPSPTA
jgi:hypothetical protein